jgi:hypothetical protein
VLFDNGLGCGAQIAAKLRSNKSGDSNKNYVFFRAQLVTVPLAGNGARGEIGGMKPSLSQYLHQQISSLDTEHGRQRLVTIALNIAHGTALMPKAYERMLLDQFVRGNLTLDEVIARLEGQEHE